MKDDKKVPQLRFPEFTDAWKQRKLREVVKEFYNGKTPYRQNKAYWGGNVNWLTSGDLNRDVVTNTIEKITEEGQKASRLRIIPKGTLVIAIMGLEAASTRGNCGILGIDTTINQACMALIANASIATKDFLFQWYKAFGNRLALKFTQGTKQQNYNEELLGNLDISYPSLKEQQQIGAFFTQLDNTITLQQRKLNSLQKLKKGLLQKMFPKKGENIPEIRFPEFSDAWKQRELKEVVNFSRGQGLPWADVDDLNGQFECILYGNLYTDYGTIIQNIKHKTNTDLKVKSKGNEVLIPGSDTTPTGLARALFLEKENVILGGDINILSVKHDDGPFLAYELNKLKKELIIRIKGTTVKHLQNNDLKDIVVSLPSLEEQRKISSLFSRLDNTITLQQRKLESLQKLKKGLLQQMFI
jgi:type I restriction enzyme S subunit